MANRSGGVHVSQVAQLTEARQSLEAALGFPVSASIGNDLRLVAYPRTATEASRVPTSHKGFPVEARETPKAG